MTPLAQCVPEEMQKTVFGVDSLIAKGWNACREGFAPKNRRTKRKRNSLIPP